MRGNKKRSWVRVGNALRITRLQSVALFVSGITLIVAGFPVIWLKLASPSPTVILTLLLSWAFAGHAGAFQVSISGEDWSSLRVVSGATAAATAITSFTQLVATSMPVVLGDVVVTATLAIAALLIGIHTGRLIMRSLWRADMFRTTAVVVGGSRLTEELVVELAHRRELGIDVVNHLDLRDGRIGQPPTADDLVSLVESIRPDRVIVGDTAFEDHELVRALRRIGTLGVRIFVLPRLFEMGVGNSLFSADQLRGFPLQRINRPAHPRISLALKRAFDIAVSSIALLALLPLLTVAAIAVKVTSPGPILFWQDRVGQHNRPIRVPKLRSMSTSETSDTEWTAEARITPVGRFLRRSAIDELPQLWSVLCGDMSLVGPRPERPSFVALFADEHAGYEDRHRMKVGLTGLSQIAGLRGDTSIAERAKYDNRYIDQWSFSGDLVILVRTVVAIVRERVYAARHASLAEALNSELILSEIDDISHRPKIAA